jgi:hypothetical protein
MGHYAKVINSVVIEVIVATKSLSITTRQMGVGTNLLQYAGVY